MLYRCYCAASSVFLVIYFLPTFFSLMSFLICFYFFMFFCYAFFLCGCLLCLILSSSHFFVFTYIYIYIFALLPVITYCPFCCHVSCSLYTIPCFICTGVLILFITVCLFHIFLNGPTFFFIELWKLYFFLLLHCALIFLVEIFNFNSLINNDGHDQHQLISCFLCPRCCFSIIYSFIAIILIACPLM